MKRQPSEIKRPTGKANQRDEKIKLSVNRKKVIDLLQSGFAGIDKNGNIVDRRKTQVFKALNENRALSIPAPKKV